MDIYTYICIYAHIREYTLDIYIIGEYACMHGYRSEYVCIGRFTSNIHQTCTYIDEYRYIYVYTHKYAWKNQYLDEYACMYAYTSEYVVVPFGSRSLHDSGW
jgi:hypothetical protein